MEIVCEWIDEINIAKSYFGKYGWRLTSVEQLEHNFYKGTGGKTNGNITIYVVEG